MKKGVVVLLLCFVVLSMVFVLAQEEDVNSTGEDEEVAEENEETKELETDNSLEGVDRAYQCLEGQLEDKSESSLSLGEAIFSMLALGSTEKLDGAIESNKGAGGDCWPKSACDVKETAQVLLAYDRTGKDGGEIEDWLLSQEKNAKELTWYIEIDIQDHVTSECDLNYDSVDAEISVKEDMKLEGSPGRCLSIGYGGYWLKVNDNCLDTEFEISCNQDFVTTLSYQRGSSGTVFISSETHSSASLGTTNEKVNAKCLSTGSGCDYEGTLWGAVALEKTGSDVSSYIPYLLALADNNAKFFPSSFLYVLTGGEDQFSEVVQKRKAGGFWDITGGENRFYDTSLAMFALGGTGAGEVETAKSYLLDIQTNAGCWNNNNIRDTAFILYSGWPRGVGSSGGSGGGFGQAIACESAGYYCENPFRCGDSGGNLLYEYDCSLSGVGLECCSAPVREEICQEIGGDICRSGEICDGRIVSSVEGSCCIGVCEERLEENICESRGGDCRLGCSDSEEATGDSCADHGRVCCISTGEPPEPEGLNVWIIVLIVLIVLVILAILFRNKIKIWLWRRRGKARVRKVHRPPRGLPPGAVSRFSSPPQRQAPARRSAPRAGKSPADKEIEETMKKLKEMSK
jgi:hypothetical protein